MKRWLAGGALVLAALGLAACAPETGTVEKQHFEAGHMEDYPIFVDHCYGSGKSRFCTTSVIYSWRWVPDDFELYIVNGEEHGWRTVFEYAYVHCGVGKHYPECANET